MERRRLGGATKEAPAVRQAAASVLGGMRVNAAAANLERLLWDPRPEVRTCSAWALGQLGRDEVVPRFVELAQGPFDYYYDPMTQIYECES